MRRLRISSVRHRALGPITVEVGGQSVKLGGPRQQMVLAVLLSRANQVVSQDSLIDAVWAGEPPEAARATLQSYIYGLRRSIGSEAILRRGDGYLIQADSSTFDVADFEERVETGHRLLESNPEEARDALVEGLAMWFGLPYGGVDHPELRAEIHRLIEVRVGAIESRVQSDLQLGRDGELVGELESLVREYPFRERFWGQLMLALYRSGRQAEALRTYQHARERLVEDLGIEPGMQLRQLEERILAQDPSLSPDRPPRAAVQQTARGLQVVRGYELREVLSSTDIGVTYRGFQPTVGREVVVRAIRPAVANDPDFVARFESDAQSVTTLEHPHILTLLDYWREPSGAYLVVPLMSGGSLSRALREGSWRLEPTIRLLDQVGGALVYAHRRGVVHGCLSTSSVLLDDEGNAYLGDFGIGRLLPDIQPTVRSDIHALGLITREMLTDVDPSEVTGQGGQAGTRTGLPGAIAEVIERATAADPNHGYRRVSDYLRDLRRAAGVDVSAGSDVTGVTDEPVRNPYKGLRAFAEEDSVDFHGRESLVNDLLERISEHRLVTLVGPSGCGKSSVVRAGVIPSLRAGGLPGARDWLITDMFPGSYPFEELEAALSRVAVRETGGLMSELAEPTGLIRACKQILPGDDSTMLILIDQFEEVFSLVRSEETRRRFLENLVAVANDERGRIRVVTTIRADFLDRPLSYGDFAAAMGPGIVTAGPPTREGMAQAIAAPARAVGVDLEPGLVARIVSDVEGQPGALPLLQYALTEAFAARAGSTLNSDAYEAAGGVEGALARRAEELYEDLGPSAQEVAREIFLRLVSVDELGTVTRRRVRQRDLTSLAVDRAAIETVLNAYAGFRLLTFDRDPVTRGPTVEVAHEALLTEWPRLREWIDEAREGLVLARRVGESAHDWLDSGRDPSYLLRGSRLDDIEAWASDPGVTLTSDENAFISASVVQRDEERIASRRRRQRTLLALSLGMVLVSLLALLALIQRESARREATLSRARELAGISRQISNNPELSLLIAVEAFDTSTRTGADPVQEAVSSIARAVSDWRLETRFPSTRFNPAASPDGARVVAMAQDNPANLAVFDVNGGAVAELPGPDLTDFDFDEEEDAHPQAAAAAFHPQSELVAVAYSAHVRQTSVAMPEGAPDIVVFRASTGEPVAQIDIAPIPFGLTIGAYSMSFSPSGDLLALSGGEQVVIVDWARARESASLRLPGATGLAAFLSEDRILVPVESHGWTTYSISEGVEISTIEVGDLTAIAAADKSGRRVVHRAGERVEVFDTATGEALYRIEDPGALVVAISPDGSRAAYSGYDSTIHVVDLDDDGGEIRLYGALANLTSLAFVGPDQLLSNGENAFLWNISPAAVEEVGLASLAVPQWGFQVSPEERWLAYPVAANTGVPIFDAEDGIRLVDLAAQDEVLARKGEVMSVPAGLRWVSPDFALFGSLLEDGSSSIRLLPSWEMVKELERCRAALVFSPEGNRVLLSGSVCPDDPDGAANTELIDMETDEVLLTLPYQSTFSADFNPEGVFEAGRYLAATDQLSLTIWDTATGEEMGNLAARTIWEAILVIAFDPSGRYVVGGTSGGTVWILDLAAVVDGAELDDAIVFETQAHTGAAPAPALNSSGQVASAGFDGLVRVWDMETGRLQFEFEADMTTPFVRFSADGSRLFYPHGLSIRQMPVDPNDLRALADELLTRDFLPDECARYADRPCAGQ